jgi:hypothetical protein
MIRNGELFKEAYFCGGNPVSCANVLEDRFGEFLVRRRVLTRPADRALAVLDHFDGRLGQALVSLDLLAPVEAVQLLASQVTGKLVSACAWDTGSYEFREGEHNPWPALALELTTFPIVARALCDVPVGRLVTWIQRAGDRTACLQVDRLHAFGLEPRTRDRLELLSDGRHTLRHVLDRLEPPAERLLVTATAYVLWRCGVLQLVAD